MKTFDLAGLVALLTGAATLVGTEIFGMIKAKPTPDQVVTDWKLADKWLAAHALWADWTFRVATVAFLVWSVLHVAAGIP